MAVSFEEKTDKPDHRYEICTSAKSGITSGVTSMVSRLGSLAYSKEYSGGTSSSMTEPLGRPMFGPPGVPVRMFEKVCREVVTWKNRHMLLKREYEEGLQSVDELQKENVKLRSIFQKISERFILDDEGMPRETKELVLMKDENERLQLMIQALERRLEEIGKGQIQQTCVLPLEPVIPHTCPESSIRDRDAPHYDRLIQENKDLTEEVQKLKKENSKMRRDVQNMHKNLDQVFDSSVDEQQKLLHNVIGKNQELKDENKLLKMQVTTYEEDFRNERKENRKRENLVDIKLTKIREEKDRLEKKVSQQEMEIMKVHQQYRIAFDSKVKLQEEVERLKRAQRPASCHTHSIQAAGTHIQEQSLYVSMPSESFELQTCDRCGKTFDTLAKLQQHNRDYH